MGAASKRMGLLWIVVVFTACTGTLCFLNTLRGDFVYDDVVAIQKNENVAGDIPWANILKDDFWGYPIDHAQSHKSYRPISTLSFRLTKDWDGHLDPRSFHAVNIVLH